MRFLGNLILNLWDCGGQEAFVDSYLTSQRDHVFRNVEVLIYVFDIESREFSKDLSVYMSCLDALQANSPQANIFVLLHKMDLAPESQRGIIFQDKSSLLQQKSLPFSVDMFATSIWDESLYKAWSSIMYTLVPNMSQLEYQLQLFADIIMAEEVVLFERATFLLVSHVEVSKESESEPLNSHSMIKQIDPTRFEKVSNIIKQFKLSCGKLQSQFELFDLKTNAFTAYIGGFTTNMYIMVIITQPNIEIGAIQLNIDAARTHFEELDQMKAY